MKTTKRHEDEYIRKGTTGLRMPNSLVFCITEDFGEKRGKVVGTSTMKGEEDFRAFAYYKIEGNSNVGLGEAKTAILMEYKLSVGDAYAFSKREFKYV